MTGEWWDGLGPVEVPIACGDATHRVRWEAGTVRALDHDDADGERALAALGGERHPCIDVLDAWARHRHDVRVLALASRGAADPLHVTRPAPMAHPGLSGGYPFASRPVSVAPLVQTLVAGGSSMVGATGVVGGVLGRRPAMPFGTAPFPGMPGPPDELLTLLTLSGALADRLAAGVAAHWGERLIPGNPEASSRRNALVAALYGRVVCTAREWLGEPQLEIDLEVADGDRAPSIERIAPDVVGATLPLDWIWRVWARGLAVILGRFTLAVTASDDERLTLLTAGPSIRDLRPLTITLD